MAIDTTAKATSVPNPPKFVQKIFNGLVTVVLRSPLHSILSNGTLLFTYTGRKSGASYTFPVGYAREGDTILIFVRSFRLWWKNLQGSAPVSLVVRGQKLKGIAQDPIVADEKVKMENFLTFVHQNPVAAKFYDVKMGPDGQPDMETVGKAVDGLVFIKVNLV